MGRRGPQPTNGATPIFNVRLPLALRQKLEETAIESGRTLSKEIIDRLRQSLSEDEINARKFGSDRNYRLTQAIGSAIALASEGKPDWLDNPEDFDMVAAVVSRALDRIRPGGSLHTDGNRTPWPDHFAVERLADQMWFEVASALDPAARYANIKRSLGDTVKRSQALQRELVRRTIEKIDALPAEQQISLDDPRSRLQYFDLEVETLNEMFAEGLGDELDAEALKTVEEERRHGQGS